MLTLGCCKFGLERRFLRVLKGSDLRTRSFLAPCDGHSMPQPSKPTRAQVNSYLAKKRSSSEGRTPFIRATHCAAAHFNCIAIGCGPCEELYSESRPLVPSKTCGLTLQLGLRATRMGKCEAFGPWQHQPAAWQERKQGPNRR